MQGVHLIMPMGGQGSRFFKNGFVMPKPLIQIQEKPFFYWATRSVQKFNELRSLTFVVLSEHVRQFHIDSEIKKFFPEASIVVIPKVLPGPVLTCLQGVSEIYDDAPILFNDCDHMFCSCALNDALNNDVNFQGGILSFAANGPQYGYLCFDDKMKVSGTVEKKVVSNRAICGAYLFQNRNVFCCAAEEYLKDCEYSEYYMSGLYNVLCKHNQHVVEFPVDFLVNFGTPEEYAIAENSEYFSSLL